MYSVVIPTYNRCKLLAEAIESVLFQAHATAEIIIVDDGSTDATAEMIAKHYSQVRYVYQSNQGPAAARNRGIREATGELIAFLDSDDIWLDNKMDIELQLLHEYPSVDILAGNSCAFIEDNLRSQDVFAQRNIIFNQQQPRFFDWSMPIMQKGPVCCTSSMTIRRSVLLQLGEKPFDESLRLDEDWDLEFRLFSQFNALLYPQIVCRTRVFDDGTRHFYTPQGRPKSKEEQQLIWRQQKDIIERYLNNPFWGPETKESFQQRQHELSVLLN